MDRADEFVEAVTRRLRTDRELHLDVAHEVRAHLEDAAAEARAQGRSEGDALEAALRAFGDPEQVAEQLYEANRRRMRLHALGKWTNRLVLVPAALALALLLGSLALSTWRSLFGGPPSMADAEPLPAPRAGLTADEQFIHEHLTNRLADAEQLVARFPDDPVLYAHYVVLLSGRFYTADPQSVSHPATDEQVQGWFAALDRGKEVEPDNALYEYLKAALLMMRSSDLEPRAGLTVEYPDPNAEGGVSEWQGGRIVIRDARVFERAMAEVEQGMARPYLTGHTADFVRLAEGLWRPARTLSDWQQRVWWWADLLLTAHPALVRDVCERLAARAEALAEEGDADGAARLAGLIPRPALQVGMGVASPSGFLGAHCCFVATAGLAPEILKLCGRPAEAARAQRTFETELAAYNRLSEDENAAGERLRAQGSFTGMWFSAEEVPRPVAWWRMDAAFRRAEHLALERAMLGMTLAAFALLTVLIAAAAACSGWRTNPDEAPMLLFIGWRRLARVLLIGVFVPLAAYWALTRLLPFSGLRAGLLQLAWLRGLETTVLYIAVVWATASTAYGAIEQRCLEAGMEVEPARPVTTGVALIVCAVTPCAAEEVSGGPADAWKTLGAVGLLSLLFVLWQLRYLGWQWRAPAGGRSRLGWGIVPPETALAVLVTLAFVALAALAPVFVTDEVTEATIAFLIGGAVSLPVVYVLARVMQSALPEERQPWQFRRTIWRSMAPMLAVCTLALGGTSYTYLHVAEARCLAPLSRPEFQWTRTEAASYEEYRQTLSDLNRQWLAQHGVGASEPASSPGTP
jgi:hypothetical protein